MNKYLPAGLLIVAGFLLSACQQPTTTISSTTKSDTQANVPLPTEADIVWSFMNLIKEGNIPKAVALLDGSQNFNDATRQAWATQFNNWGVEKITQITPEAGKFRVEWSNQNGGDTKWISVIKKEGQLWKIGEIATGP